MDEKKNLFVCSINLDSPTDFFPVLMKHSDCSLHTEGDRGEISHRDVVILSLAARSLGSVALRKAENLDRRIHMNVFTIDFNEELVALYGGSLRRQTQFLYESIKAILRLYKVRGQGHLFSFSIPFVPLLSSNFLSILFCPFVRITDHKLVLVFCS